MSFLNSFRTGSWCKGHRTREVTVNGDVELLPFPIRYGSAYPGHDEEVGPIGG